ncbi:MAG: glycosyltransferase family 39 protein, partial [Thermomicrobiales bacterium]|nr:glycosyltransferase family 39 protein [Thermomicrobiales bacterium]
MSAEQQTAPISARPRSTRREPPLVLARAQSTSLSIPLFVAAVHWLIVQITATLAQRYGEANDPSLALQIPVEPHRGWLSHQIIDPLRNWDGLWYRLIAIEGYDLHSAQAAFWPLFPWAMRALSDLTGMSVDVAGYLIANVSFVIALVLLYRLVSLDFDERVARVTIWAIALFPTALFFSAVYTESPFLMLMVGSLYAARRGNWWLAGIVGALAALTRSYGVFLVAPLGLLFIQERGFYLRQWIPTALAPAMPVLGPALFSWHLERIDKPWADMWLWKDVQEQWNRFSAKPWETLQWGFSSSPEGRTIGQTEHSHYDGAYWGWLRDLIDNPTWSTIVCNGWRRDVAESDTV